MRMHPIEFLWTEDHIMRPMMRFANLAAAQFTVGQTYTLVVNEERSSASHRHYHACVREAWENLNDEATARYPTPTHLRRWALVKCGYYDERSYVCASAQQATEIASFIKPLNEYVVIVIRGDVVKVYTPKSQSYAAMSKDEFEKSKQDVLTLLSGVLGVKKSELEKAGKASEGE